MCFEPSVITSQPRSLNDLPEEILLNILSHFGLEELCIIAKVCERWSALAKDLILWKKLSYECDLSSDINHIKAVLTAAPALHSLIVRERNDVADILEFLFHKCGDLRKLILEHCWLGEDGTGLFANIVDLFPDLEVLSLLDCQKLTPASYGLIPLLKKLSELNLSDYVGLSGKTVRLIADSCQHLKKLSLYGGKKVDDDDVIHVINKLGKQLTTLVLDGFELTDVVYLYLNNCARLQELKLFSCMKMTDRGLLEGIGSLHDLTSLHLQMDHSLTAQALSTFLHRPSMASIVSLNLSFCRSLDDEGLKGIAERCIHLKELTVGWCDNVTDAGISKLIRHCNQLRVLNLSNLLSITGEGYLALVPAHLPHLRELCLGDCCNVCDKYVEELVATAPQLKIIT